MLNQLAGQYKDDILILLPKEPCILQQIQSNDLVQVQKLGFPQEEDYDGWCGVLVTLLDRDLG